MSTTNVIVTIVILLVIAAGGVYYLGYFGAEPAVVEDNGDTQ